MGHLLNFDGTTANLQLELLQVIGGMTLAPAAAARLHQEVHGVLFTCTEAAFVFYLHAVQYSKCLGVLP